MSKGLQSVRHFPSQSHDFRGAGSQTHVAVKGRRVCELVCENNLMAVTTALWREACERNCSDGVVSFHSFTTKGMETKCTQPAQKPGWPKQTPFRNKFQRPYRTCAHLILERTCLFRTAFFPPTHNALEKHWNNFFFFGIFFFFLNDRQYSPPHRRWKVEGTDWAQNWTSLLLRMTPAQIKAKPLAVVDTTTARIKDVDISPGGASPWGPAAESQSQLAELRRALSALSIRNRGQNWKRNQYK